MAKLKTTHRPSASPASQFKVIQDRTAETMRAVLSEDVRRREAVVKDWKAEHRPDFEGVVTLTPQGIRGAVLIRNADERIESGATIGDLWRFWNEGTPAHEIVADEGGILVFEVGGKTVFTRRVSHPGTPAHNDDEEITLITARTAEAKLKNGIGQALKEAARKK